jgi:pantoate kinase
LRRKCICVSIPHHITAFFIPKYTGDLLTTGSYGAGILVGPEAIVCIGPGEKPKWSPLNLVFDELKASGLGSKIIEPLPPGMGYASSAASALGGAIGIAILKNLPLSKALLTAHVAEIKASTGLGDVQAIASNPIGEGVVIRTRPGAPLKGSIEVLPIPSTISLLSIELGKMDTKSLLKVYDLGVARASISAFKKLVSDPTFEKFLEVAQEYTDTLLRLNKIPIKTEIIRKLRRTPGLLGYYIKKLIAVLIVDADKIEDAVSYLSKEGLKIRLLETKTMGIRVVPGACNHERVQDT